VVVLKRLEDARADGDRILAVIRGSALNQDGPSSGLTAPSGPAQEAVIREALARAGLAPGDVSYVEAHGTGTQLGDPLEVHALGAVFGPGRDPRSPLWIGSVKTNLGHLEGAAGVVGLIKVVLSLQHRELPAHLHFRTPSPHIAWGDLPLRVPTAHTPWEPVGGRRIAGVSSFGFSGTNAHVVLEEAPEAAPAAAVAADRPAALVPLSAHDAPALRALAARHAAALAGAPAPELADVAFTLGVGRAHLAERAAVVARSVPELQGRLAALAQGDGREIEGVRAARRTLRDPPKVAFLFTGQGAQYAGMARGLYAAAPVFRETLDRCAAILAPLLPRPLLEVLWPAPGAPADLDQTGFTQPALFAVEVALAELWRSWGVVPAAVMGHSVGEYAAAHVAGVLGLEDALRLIAARGRLMQSLPAGGAMAAVAAPEERVAAALAPYRSTVAIAAVNAPDQTVVSGRAADVQAIAARFAAEGVKTNPLTVSHAFHSPLMDPILDAFEREAGSVALSAPRLRLVSNLTGRVADADVTRPASWRRHVREAVRFHDGLRALAALKPDVVIELGPHPTLLTLASGVLGDACPVLVGSLRKGRPDWEQLLDGLGALYLAGADLDWRGVDRGLPRRLLALPGYPFQRERVWFQARSAPARRPAGEGHPFVGARLRTAGAEAIHEAQVAVDGPAWVADHRVAGRVLVPGAAFLEGLSAAGEEVLGTERVQVDDVTVDQALVLEDGGAPRTLQVVLSPQPGGALAATLSSAPADGPDAGRFTRHAAATIRPAPAAAPGEGAAAVAGARARCAEAVSPADLYATLERRGIALGPSFQVLRRAWRGRDEALAELELPAELAREAARHGVHPVLLDGCLQTLAAALPAADGDHLYLPVGVARFERHLRAGTACVAHVTLRRAAAGSLRADIRAFEPGGAPLLTLADVQLQRVSAEALARAGAAERDVEGWLYRTGWRDAPLAAREALPVEALVRAGAAALDALAEKAGLAEYDAFLPRLEAACVDYALRAMARLGWTPGEGERARAGDLAERLRVAARHRRLFARLLEILAEAGWLARAGDEVVVRRPWGAAPAPDLAALGAAHRCGEAELELTGRAGEALAEALRGERDPLQLLFPGGSTATAERLYRDSPTARFYNGLVAEVLAALPARADGRPLRILEVGAGTGGTTAHVAPRLAAARVEYTFTDVGPLFVARAQERFGPAHGFMRFCTLDLERDPAAQGFEAGAFDVVIASNVVHATADLRATLGRVRGLLAPGGLLALLEVTAPQRWFDLTVGLTEGWWAFTDTDLRPSYPTLTRGRWLSLLGECGFEAARPLPEGEALSGVRALQSLILARAARAGTAAAAPRRWLVLPDAGGTAAALAERLRARGDAVDVLSSADAVDLAALRAAGGPIHGVVHASSLDTPRWDETTAAALAEAEARGPASTLRLAQALVKDGAPPRLWILTRGAQQPAPGDGPLSPAQTTAWGLARTVRAEHPELACVCVDLPPGPGPDDVAALAAELDEAGGEPEVALRAAGRRVSRLERVPPRAPPPPAAPPQRLVSGLAGDLDGLRLVPLERRAPGPGEVEIAVAATGLNFKDVLNVLGMYPGDPGPLGAECAGRVVAVGPGVTNVRPGDEVLATTGGAFASHLVAPAHLVARRPAGMSAEEGASIPVAYLTAEYCLGHLARVRQGDRVLVHAAAGGVGMAAVRLALRAGAEVYATAGARWKRRLLEEMGVAGALDSRSAAFADELLAATGGRGADVVLNSLSGDLVDASFRALAQGGRFVEIGKRGIKDDAWVAAHRPDAAYHVVDWGVTAARDPALIGGMLQRLVDDLGAGALAPLPRHVFGLDEVGRAFRFMAQARHAGKIVVRHGPPAAPAIRHDGTYLVTGGLAGLGPAIAGWLADRGAGRLVLVGRRGVGPEVAPALEALRARGVEVIAEALDVTDEAALRGLLRRLRAGGPPLRGVVHSAGVLDDAALLQQDAGKLSRVLAPKVRGGWLLDEATRSDPLELFVLFSSAAAVLGSPGQANHSAANAFLDALACERARAGLPALSVNWGPWSEVGAAVERGAAERAAAVGLGAVTPAQAFLALERLEAAGGANAAVLRVDWARFLGERRSPAFLSEVAAGAAAKGAAARADAAPRAAEHDLRAQLRDAPAGRRPKLVGAFVRERALKTLGLDPARPVDPRTPLGELGLDSLLAVELRNALSKAIGKPLPATLLFDHPTLDALTEHLLGLLGGAGEAQPAQAPQAAAPAPAAATAAAPALVGDIEDLSDEEVERRLAARLTAKKGKKA
jgi:acyl transferase domain-containing protein